MKHWPTNDREWARNHIGCNPSTCPNDRCNSSGLCMGGPAHIGVGGSAPVILESRKQYNERERRGLPPHEKPPLTGGPRTIIAFIGLAGAGKTTAAKHLVLHRGFHRQRFAGPLKDMMKALGLTHEQIEGSEKETPCELLGGKTPRWAMQTIGTEWGRQLIADDIWIRAFKTAVDALPAGKPVVCDDLRFPNEAEAILAAGGYIVRIVRPGAGTTSVHESEKHQAAFETVRTIYNTLDEKNLREQVDVFLRDLSWIDGRH